MNISLQNTQNIPTSLKKLNQWVLWKLENRKGKQTKVPYTVLGNHAKTNDSQSWSSFDDVLKNLDGYSGIGFVFSKEDNLVGIDVDHPADSAESLEIIEKFNATYCERSPSGKLRIFTRGMISRCGKGTADKKIEVYNHTSPRYLTVTGDWIDVSSTDINECQDALNWLFEKYFPPKKPSPKKDVVTSPSIQNSQPLPSSLSDEDILSILTNAKNYGKFNELYRGGGPEDESSGDLSLVSLLAFYTHSSLGGGDSQLDRIMRGSNRKNLNNGKWDEVHSQEKLTYGQMTIKRASENLSNTYTPSSPEPHSPPTKKLNNPTPHLLNLDEDDTDVGHGKRFKRLHIDIARYCHSIERWLIWDEKRWVFDDDGQAYRLCENLGKNIRYESESKIKLLPKEAQANAKKKTHDIVRRLNSKRHRVDLLWCAGREEGMSVQLQNMNADPWLLNVQNGTINLKTGQLQPHSQANYITKVLPFDYNPNATCPQWKKFLNDVMNGNKELVHYLQKAIGYSLTGDTREQCFFFLYGHGSNGKSTFTTILEELLGNGEYSIRTPAKTLMKSQREDAISNDKARLAGSRLVMAAEISEGAALDEAFIKDITGNDTITARFLYKESFDFKPQFKLWMYGNHKPKINGSDYGIKRRPRLIPFMQKFEGENRDEGLLDKLRNEFEGILAWAVEGCLMWLKEGLTPPSAIVDATQGYLEEMDRIGLFLDELCIVKEGVKSKATTLYTQYTQWCGENGFRTMDQQNFGRRLTEKGFERKKSNSINWWIGIGVIDETVPQSTPKYPIEKNGYCIKDEYNQYDGVDSTHSTPKSNLCVINEKKVVHEDTTSLSHINKEKKSFVKNLGTRGTDSVNPRVIPSSYDSTQVSSSGYYKGTEGTVEGTLQAPQPQLYGGSYGSLNEFIQNMKKNKEFSKDDERFIRERVSKLGLNNNPLSPVLKEYTARFNRDGKYQANSWLRDLTIENDIVGSHGNNGNDIYQAIMSGELTPPNNF